MQQNFNPFVKLEVNSQVAKLVVNNQIAKLEANSQVNEIKLVQVLLMELQLELVKVFIMVINKAIDNNHKDTSQGLMDMILVDNEDYEDYNHGVSF